MGASDETSLAEHEGLDARLRAAQEGDVEALEDLLARAGGLIRPQLSIQPKWSPVLEVDDVLQVTYMEAFARFDRFVGDTFAAFCAWLRHIARNNLIDAVRELDRQKRPPPTQRVTVPAGSEESYISLCGLLGVTTTTPSRTAAAREARATIEQALALLPSHYEQAIRLFDLQGQTGRQVAEALGLSRSAAFMLRARARDLLRDVLGSASRFLDENA